MIKFSIIVPIYNVEEYLHQCIESLLNQTYKNLEIILVDDGSPDKSPTICDEFAAKDARIKVVHKENGGLVSARQAGIEIATGDYAICVDGDDWISFELCEKVYEVLKENLVDIICFGFFSATETQHLANPLSYKKGLYSRNDIEEKIFPMLIHTKNATNFQQSIWGKAIKLDTYKISQLNVDMRIGIAEDAACTIPCIYNAQSLYILDDCLYFYRQNDVSMTRAKKALRLDVPKILYENIKENIDISKFDFEQQLHRKVVCELFLVAVSQFNKKESYFNIKKELKTILMDSTYQNSIKKSTFTSLFGKFALFALKRKYFFLIYIYYKKNIIKGNTIKLLNHYKKH